MEKANEKGKGSKSNAGRLSKIFEGWSNKFKEHFDLLAPEKVQVANKRKTICESCPFNSKNVKQDDSEYRVMVIQGYMSLGASNVKVNPYQSHLPYEHCVWCGCEIEAKCLSFSSNCGIEDYNKNYNRNCELKWESVDLQ